MQKKHNHVEESIVEIKIFSGRFSKVINSPLKTS
jgi:hypothetical protein